MKDFSGKIAVVTGGGSGIGANSFASLSANAAMSRMCDLSVQNMAETKRWCDSGPLLQGSRITTHYGDVSDRGAGNTLPL